MKKGGKFLEEGNSILFILVRFGSWGLVQINLAQFKKIVENVESILDSSNV